jgi:anti-sigma B factor antagonist
MHYEIEDRGRFKMIHVIGNIDSTASTKELDDQITSLIGSGNHHFVFNLDQTTYLDSAGISIFIHCLADVQQNDGSIYMIAGDSQARRVLDLMGLTRLIKTYESEKEFLVAQGMVTV